MTEAERTKSPPTKKERYSDLNDNNRILVLSGKGAWVIQIRAAAASLSIQVSPTASISRSRSASSPIPVVQLAANSEERGATWLTYAPTAASRAGPARRLRSHVPAFSTS